MEVPGVPSATPDDLLEVTRPLQAALDELRNRTRIISAVLARTDGILIARSLPERGDPRIVAEMGATIIGTSSMTVAEMANGALNDILIQSDNGKVYARFADQDTLLVVLMEPSSTIGLVLMEVERTVRKLQRILAGGQV